MPDTLIEIINVLKVPKVILRYIIMNFIDLPTIKNLLFIVKEMNVLDDYSKNILTIANKGFQYNCVEGNLIVAKWLYSIERVDIHDEFTFQWSCANGQLAVVQWLYSVGNVDIHAHNEQAFRVSCEYGQLTVAQWLYSLGEGMDRTDPSSPARKGQGNVNIHVYNDQAFRLSCKKGHLTVAQWLYSLGNVDIHAYNESAFFLSDGKVLAWLEELNN